MLNRLNINLGPRHRKGAVPLALLGLFVCLGSAIVLWTNEGRADLSGIARSARLVAADSSGAEAQGELVAITGRLGVEGPAYDPDFSVGGEYLRLTREAEMYAWVEKEKDDYYNYEGEWTTSPADSSQFEYPEGHTNPPMAVQGRAFDAREGIVGSFRFDPARARLTAAEAVPLGSDLRLPDWAEVVGGYIYIGAGWPTQPAIGDIRLSYTAVQAGPTVTLYGQLRGQQVEPHGAGGTRLHGVWRGNHDEALQAMHSEYVTIGWVMRLVGFSMMWGGMLLILHPLSSLLGYVPLLGQVGRAAIWFVTFVLALLLSVIIIVVSFVLHRWYLLLALVLVGLGLAAFLVYRGRKKAVTGSAL